MPGNEIVFLLDVDNTLLDNDGFGAAWGDTVEQTFGAAGRARYWTLFSERRQQLGMADYLGTLELFRSGLDGDPGLMKLADALLNHPFGALLYPDALAVLAHLSTLGTPVLLSDGDVIFQPRKIRQSGLWEAVCGRVLVFLHKEIEVAQIQQRFPADHYVAVDDKPNLLAAMKTILGPKLTTVFVRQGHYAHDVQTQTQIPSPDHVIEQIGDLLTFNLSNFPVRS